MAAEYQLVSKVRAFGNVDAVTLWYPAPHNCWRIEVQGHDLTGKLSNMTVEEARALLRALSAAIGVADFTIGVADFTAPADT